MPPTSSARASDLQERRAALGRRLRELRNQAGLTGTLLAQALSWPQSKVSKLETARQAPTEDDLRAWALATGGEAQTDELLTALRTLEAQHAQWQSILRPGLERHHRKIAELDAKTRVFRIFEATVIPGLLQTPEYARSQLAQGIILHHAPNDLDQAVRARMHRQELLYRRDKKFHFVITEGALQLRLCAPQVMLGQLDRLITLSTLPNVRLGIISLATQYTIGPWHGFWLRDKDQVHIETFSAELRLVQDSEVALYRKIFDQFATAASYDKPARAIITRAASEFSTKESPGGSQNIRE